MNDHLYFNDLLRSLNEQNASLNEQNSSLVRQNEILLMQTSEVRKYFYEIDKHLPEAQSQLESLKKFSNKLPEVYQNFLQQIISEMIHLTQTLVERPPMDNSRNVTITNTGDFDAGQVVAGDIQGEVIKGIENLNSSPDPDHQPGIKELFTQLEAMISSLPDITNEEKNEAREKLKVLLAVEKDPKQPANQRRGKLAVNFLKDFLEGADKTLPATARVIEAGTKCLSLIGKALGLPIPF